MCHEVDPARRPRGASRVLLSISHCTNREWFHFSSGPTFILSLKDMTWFRGFRINFQPMNELPTAVPTLEPASGSSKNAHKELNSYTQFGGGGRGERGGCHD